MALLKFPTNRPTASCKQTFHCTARKNPLPAFASSCAPQKRSPDRFRIKLRHAKTLLARLHVASPAQALSDVRFNISFILYCDVDHGFVLSMIFCFFDPRRREYSLRSWRSVASLPRLSDPNGALGGGCYIPLTTGAYYFLLLCFIRSPHGGNTRFARSYLQTRRE